MSHDKILGYPDAVHPGHHVLEAPDRVALVVAGTGETTTFRELDDGSNQLARVFWEAGLRPGDHVALFSENHPRYFEVYWAALRSGLYLTPINRSLTAPEVAFIVEDSSARIVVCSELLGDVAQQLPALVPGGVRWLMYDGVRPGFESYEEAVGAQPSMPLDDQPLGEVMFYSSGTTGRPKGIVRPLSGKSIDSNPAGKMARNFLGMADGAVYLSTAPLYHTAALGFAAATQALGGTCVLMERFDAEEALRSIEIYGVTHTQWVPTMFKRLLDLPQDTRERYDLSTHQVALHGAAPCPVELKRGIIEWWGPIVLEYYSATEGNGMTVIDSHEWLTHVGSVGRPVFGSIHICDENGGPVPTGEDGLVYFERETLPFAYRNDDARTSATCHPEHPLWTTLGDVGHVDDDGYLYLTDRHEFLIISGGVNIYPAESELLLLTHPLVADVAVIGVPDPEFGEAVKAVGQLRPGDVGTPEREAELIAFCRSQLAHFKCPRSIDFVEALPRLETGKLAKKALRDRYRAAATGSGWTGASW